MIMRETKRLNGWHTNKTLWMKNKFTNTNLIYFYIGFSTQSDLTIHDLVNCFLLKPVEN